MRLSKKWGLDTPEIKLSKAPLLNGEKGALALNVIRSLTMQYTAEDISQQCFGYMYFVKESLESALQSHLYYTLGYVMFNHKPVFYTAQDELKKKIKKSIVIGDALNLHAWLTTPNMEIIDLTFGTTFGIVNDKPSAIGCCSFQHYSTFNDKMMYHPQLVGDDYLRRIGAFIEF